MDQSHATGGSVVPEKARMYPTSLHCYHRLKLTPLAEQKLPQGVEEGVPDSVHDTGNSKSHATGDSIVPKAVQEAVPKKLEEVLPNKIHDTSAGGAATSCEYYMLSVKLQWLMVHRSKSLM